MPVPWKHDISATHHGVAPCDITDASDRAITLQQLRQLRDYVKRLCKVGILKRDQSKSNNQSENEDRIFWFTINQYDINELVIKKVIKELAPQDKACSWVELVADPDTKAQKPDTYLSHAWAESFRDFMLSVEHHAHEKRLGPDHTYWFCVCANNQFNISGELDTTLKGSPFFRALEEAQETLLLLDRDGVVMKRAWCLFEWYQTMVALQRPNTLQVSTGTGLVGSAMVSSGKYVDLLNGINSLEAEASDPRDLRRIQNCIAGDEETKDLDMIARIERTNGRGWVVTEKEHSLQDGDVVVYKKGVGISLCDIFGNPFSDGDKFQVKVSKQEQRTLILYQHDDKSHTANFQQQVSVKDGRGASLMNVDYLETHERWLDKNRLNFDKLDAHMKGQTLSNCQECFDSKHNRGDMSSPAFRAITLSQLRTFAQRVRGMYNDEQWDYQKFHKVCYRNRIALGDTGPGEHIGRYKIFKASGALKWEQITWYHVKHLVILEKLLRESPESCSSYVESLPDKRALRGQYMFTFAWDVSFSEFMDGIEWYAEARQMPDTTPLLIYPLTMNVTNRDEYYDGGVWEACMRACESSVIFAGNLNRVGPLLDIQNAVSQNKSIDLMCGTGALALTKPFAGGSWEFGRFDIASALKCVKIDANLATTHDQSFMERLRSLGPVGVTKLNGKLRSAGAGPVLREAAYHDDEETAELVFKQCPWLSIQSARLQGPLGETPLHIAASAGKKRVIKLLLERGADVSAVDFDGETPLHYAALAGQDGSAKMLLDAGADPQYESYSSETPMEVALQQPAFFLVDYCAVHGLLSQCGLEVDGSDNHDEAHS